MPTPSFRDEYTSFNAGMKIVMLPDGVVLMCGSEPLYMMSYAEWYQLQALKNGKM